MRYSFVSVLPPERWLSGRKHRFAKAASGYSPDPGFESLPLRINRRESSCFLDGFFVFEELANVALGMIFGGSLKVGKVSFGHQKPHDIESIQHQTLL